MPFFVCSVSLYGKVLGIVWNTISGSGKQALQSSACAVLVDALVRGVRKQRAISNRFHPRLRPCPMGALPLRPQLLATISLLP